MGNITSMRSLTLAAGLVAMTGMVADTAAAETRGFVVNYIHVATHRDEGNCPNGGNGASTEISKFALARHGFSEEDAQAYIERIATSTDEEAEFYYNILTKRGIKDGEFVSSYKYPGTVPFHGSEIVQGPYAYGFNLDGEVEEGGFSDPETGEAGVDNQLFRAIGCFDNFNISYPTRPWWAQQAGSDMLVVSRAQAWLFTITADDFTTDGKAEVSFYRAREHFRLNRGARALGHLTYTVDPDPRNRGTLTGVIENGVFRSTGESAEINLIGGFPGHLKLNLKSAQMRVKFEPDGSVVAYLGGYQPWRDYWFFASTVGDFYFDVTEGFHLFQKLADADPDPITNNNRAISSTFRIDAVPAFIAGSDGTFFTSSK